MVPSEPAHYRAVRGSGAHDNGAPRFEVLTGGKIRPRLDLFIRMIWTACGKGRDRAKFRKKPGALPAAAVDLVAGSVVGRHGLLWRPHECATSVPSSTSSDSQTSSSRRRNAQVRPSSTQIDCRRAAEKFDEIMP